MFLSIAVNETRDQTDHRAEHDRVDSVCSYTLDRVASSYFGERTKCGRWQSDLSRDSRSVRSQCRDLSTIYYHMISIDLICNTRRGNASIARKAKHKVLSEMIGK